MILKRLLFAMPLILAAAHDASAQVVKFQMLDEAFSANDMSPDGRYVVGFHINGGGYLWTRENGYTLLGGEYAAAVSDDGTVVLGKVEDPVTGHSEAAIWNAVDGWQQLPAVGTGCPYFMSAYELSADGTAAVGLAWDSCSGTGFRWTEEGGTIALDSLANGNNRASVISGDGTLIGGFAQGSSNRTPAVWGAGGDGQLLDPPNGDVVGEVHGINDDGTVLLGEWNGKPFTWTQGDAGPDIFNPAIPGWIGSPMDIADDGTIVGFDYLGLGRRIDPPNGGPIVLLEDYLEGLGVTNVPVNGLHVCQAISTSGNIIIGQNFFDAGWRLNLCAADFENDGTVATTDLLTLLAAWGPCTGCVEDLDEDGNVGVTDLLLLLGVWGECI